jgi:CDP-diacylglycerol--glycerol-3-phosphate 3-phosphatidyltransferase
MIDASLFAPLLPLGVLFGLVFVSMAIYAVSPARREPDLLESSSRGDFVLGSFTRSWFYWFIAPLVNGSLRLGLSPTFYNVLGAVLGWLGGVGFALGHMALGGWGVLLGGAADVLDGRIARAQGIASPRGAFLDSTLDRFAEVGAFVGLALWFGTDRLALLAVVVALGGSLLVSYARARGESVGVLCTGGVMQRAERLLLLGLAGLFDAPVVAMLGHEAPGTLLFAALSLIAVGTFGTAIYRTVWIANRL